MIPHSQPSGAPSQQHHLRLFQKPKDFASKTFSYFTVKKNLYKFLQRRIIFQKRIAAEQ